HVCRGHPAVIVGRQATMARAWRFNSIWCALIESISLRWGDGPAYGGLSAVINTQKTMRKFMVFCSPCVCGVWAILWERMWENKKTLILQLVESQGI
ncbi:hypothetical protein, partial [Methylomonas koyamae]|uniref:hypothetical protein n=1 Tax=Methylomonas koyamae TaxID=702114 RepID=UPI001E4C04EB